LIKNKDKYKLVFKANIKNTIIQKDIFIFCYYNTPFIYLFLDGIILNTKMNKDWLLLLIDEKGIQNELYNKRVIYTGINSNYR